MISTKISKDTQNLTPKDHRILMDLPKDLGESKEMSTNMSYARCAACKYLRRRCSEDCVLAPYFPATYPYRFSCVHKIFGASNICRMLQQLPVQQRSEAADSMSYEAYCRIQDPVYGIVKNITHLQQQISTGLNDLAQTKAQIAIFAGRQPEIAVEVMENYQEEFVYESQQEQLAQLEPYDYQILPDNGCC